MLISKETLEKKLSAELVQFADCLVPSQEFDRDGKSLVNKVFDHLKCKFKVSHTFIGGSSGKKTSVIFPDFDCVVFLNNIEPCAIPSKVKEIRDSLEEHANSLLIDVETLKTTAITVQVKFKTGVEMDLLPACNYNQYSAKDQYSEALKRILNPDDSYNKGHCSSSLAQTQLNFIQSQSGATHQLIRIAKYWYKSGYFWSYGGSAIIEILCVCTAHDLNNSFSMLSGLKHFFSKYICKLDSLKIAFYPENGKWKKLSPEQMQFHKSHFDSEILTRSNFIIEPANPWNDMAPNLKDNLEEMKSYGEEMLDRLERMSRAEPTIFRSTKLSLEGPKVEIVFEYLFQPFKLDLKKFFDISAIPSKVYIQYDYNYGQSFRQYGIHAVTVHNFDFFKQNSQARWAYETVLTNLLFLIRSKACRLENKPLTFVNGLPVIPDSSYDLRLAVESFTSVNFLDSQCVETNSDEVHDRSFVTLKIPYVDLHHQKYAVRVSMTWATARGNYCTIL